MYPCVGMCIWVQVISETEERVGSSGCGPPDMSPFKEQHTLFTSEPSLSLTTEFLKNILWYFHIWIHVYLDNINLSFLFLFNSSWNPPHSSPNFMLLPPPLYLPLNNPLSPFNAALMPMKIRHHPMEHGQPITGHATEKTAPSYFRIYQLSIALAARCELMIDFLIWGLSTQPGLALNSCFSHLSLLNAKMAFHPVLVLSEEADLWSAKPLSGLYSMALQQEEKDKVSRLLTALDSVECFWDPWWFWVIIWWLGTGFPRGEGETAYFLWSFQSWISECSEQHCGFRGPVHLEQDPDWVGLHTEKRGLDLQHTGHGKPSQVTCLLEADGELRQIGRAAILERQPLR